uniref:Small ribosomal subunit protein bS16c n=1 Tax=Diphelypaea coccinea TaxID=223087 RepID=A0A514TN96_9LAMI|nr:ribosomal protein S16 [Diphelypaea coccinea]QDJ93975.1 ribosomal protein S16 [Diphelypaea coccinea]
MVKLRLQRCGKKQQAYYRIVAIDVRSRREGKSIKKIGFYDPKRKYIYFNIHDLIYFFEKGAQPTEIVRYLLRKYLKEHLSNQISRN